MNYNKIKEKCFELNISIKYLCQEINISEQGLNQMIRNQSMKIEVIENIAKVLDIPVCYFFEEDFKIQERKKEECPLCREKEERIKDKEEIIQLLKKQLQNYEHLNLKNDKQAG